ncbi:unnamed protein product [Cunninghamella echinulata]
MKPPQHPGNPKWKTFTEWRKTSKPNAIIMPVSTEQLQQDLLKKFNLKDESNKTEAEIWGEVQLMKIIRMVGGLISLVIIATIIIIIIIMVGRKYIHIKE